MLKKVVCICGSAHGNSGNLMLLETIAGQFQYLFKFDIVDGLWNLPLYTPQREAKGIPLEVKDLRNRVTKADAVIISTPEYLHNIPAVLKNALEWMTNSGDLMDKPVLAITFTPKAPRGEHAMRSLVASLLASKARVVAEFPLYQDQISKVDGYYAFDGEHLELIGAALDLL